MLAMPTAEERPPGKKDSKTGNESYTGGDILVVDGKLSNLGFLA